MDVLVTNDDGIDSPGLAALVEGLRERARVWVVAPNRNYSAVAHSITIRDPLIVEPRELPGAHAAFAVTGTPADCVKLAVRALVETPLDLVFSGANLGLNLGMDVHYSGTVAAAAEAISLGVPSAALSVERTDAPALDVAGRIAASILAKRILGWPAGCFLNVNVPSPATGAPIRGIRIVRQGGHGYREEFIRRTDPQGRSYFWLSGATDRGNAEPGTDLHALSEGFVTVTPLRYNLTNPDLLGEVETWDLNGFLPA